MRSFLAADVTQTLYAEKTDVTRRHAIDGVLSVSDEGKEQRYLNYSGLLRLPPALLLPLVLLPLSSNLTQAPATTASSAGTPEHQGRLCSLRKKQ